MNAEFANLFDQIDLDSVILTPNRRLAADLLEQYTHYQVSKKLTIWEKPTILPVDAWIHEIWYIQIEASPDQKPIVLSEEQELIIWENIIKNSASNNLLFNYLESAKLAKDTNDLINQWAIPIEQIDPNYSPDCQQFTKWYKQFKSHLKDNCLLEPSLISSKLTEHIEDFKYLLPSKIIFAFFDEFIPIILELKNCLKKYSNITTYENTLSSKKCFQYIAKNTEDELIDLVCWARTEYLSNKSRIACVVTDLASNRNKIEKIAKEYLHHDNTAIPYDISAGKPLLEYPIITAIFKLLSISDKLSVDLASDIISSPFIKDSSHEKRSRMILIQQINDLGILDIELSHILLLAKDSTASYYCPTLSVILETIHNYKTSLKKFSPSLWITQITKIIYMAGWPGDDIINSEEFQVFKKFETVLIKFSALDHVIDKVTYTRAISILERFTIKTEFQIQSPKTPIQFLGLLEAAGRDFDCIWITNITSTTWPQAKRPNPFIPIPLQLKYNLPHSSYERELEFSSKLTERFSRSANCVIFSYGAMQKDLTQYSSPLIKHLPLFKKEFDNNNSIYINPNKPNEFDYYQDNSAPSITNQETPRGGSEIVRLQSECPFKAFARFRLDIKPKYTPSYGLSYLQRGILMHYCLEKIWNKLKSSQQLHKLTKLELTKLVSSYIEIAISTKVSPKFIQYHGKLIKLEKQRLTRLIISWLEFEKQRQPFTCISTEKHQKLNLKNISMDLRVDRIDQVNTDHVIIDYKSTIYPGLDWFSDRPDSPQLLLYLISAELPISAIVFAQIKFGKTLFRGLSSNNIGIDGVTIDSNINTKQSWTQQKHKWKKILENLVIDFKKGNAELDPKYITTCTNCNFSMLCRINDQEMM